MDESTSRVRGTVAPRARVAVPATASPFLEPQVRPQTLIVKPPHRAPFPFFLKLPTLPIQWRAPRMKNHQDLLQGPDRRHLWASRSHHDGQEGDAMLSHGAR